MTRPENRETWLLRCQPWSRSDYLRVPLVPSIQPRVRLGQEHLERRRSRNRHCRPSSKTENPNPSHPNHPSSTRRRTSRSPKTSARAISRPLGSLQRVSSQPFSPCTRRGPRHNAQRRSTCHHRLQSLPSDGNRIRGHPKLHPRLPSQGIHHRLQITLRLRTFLSSEI